jgi:TIR domain
MEQDGVPRLEIREYWGFISYSHADEKWAVWLHRHLERYRFPRRLRGRKTAAGIVPKSIAPLFRDRDEFAGAADLTEAATLALRCSRSLVVVCSPSAARSEWVGREVRIFRSLGRSHRVFCCIVDGDPAGPAAESFPDAVTENYEQTGVPPGTPVLPLACDARPGKDGKRNAALKLLAAIVDIPYDELHSRERRRRRFRWGVGSAAVALICAVVVLVGWMLFNLRDASGILQAMSLGQIRQDKAAVNQALWQITGRSYSVRSALLGLTGSDPGAASGLAVYPSLIEACAGLSPGLRRKFADDVLDNCYDARDIHTETGLACTLLAIGLDEGSPRGVEFLLKRGSRKFDSAEMYSAGLSQRDELTAAEYMVRRLPPKNVSAAFDLALSMVAAREDKLDAYVRSRYFFLLGHIADRLPPNRIPAVATRIRELRTTDHCGPGFVLTSIPGAMPAGEAITMYRHALAEALLPSSPVCADRAEMLASLLKAMDPPNRLHQLQQLLDRLVQPDGAEQVIWAGPVVRHYAQELSPGDWQRYMSRVGPVSSAAADLEGAAKRLEPVPAKYCAREAAGLFSLLMEQRWLRSRDSIPFDDYGVRVALISAGSKLNPADGAKAAAKIGALMKDGLEAALADVLDSIPGELSIPALEPCYNVLFAEWQRSPGNVRCLRSLAARLPPVVAGDALGRVLHQLDLPKFRGDESRLSEGAELIEALAARLPASGRKRALPDVLALLEREHLLPCSVLSSFTARDTFPLIVAVAKWPTCFPDDRNRLIQRVGQIENRDFGVGSHYTDIWGFIRWAEKRGYDVDSPPSARLPRAD